MKSTGMVRQLDTLGRIVIPVELRRPMDLFGIASPVAGKNIILPAFSATMPET